MKYYENNMSNIQQILDPNGHIKFFLKKTNFEKHLTKLENSNLDITNCKILYIIAKVSLRHNFFTNLNQLDQIVKK